MEARGELFLEVHLLLSGVGHSMEGAEVPDNEDKDGGQEDEGETLALQVVQGLSSARLLIVCIFKKLSMLSVILINYHSQRTPVNLQSNDASFPLINFCFPACSLITSRFV